MLRQLVGVRSHLPLDLFLLAFLLPEIGAKAHVHHVIFLVYDQLDRSLGNRGSQPSPRQVSTSRFLRKGAGEAS